MTEAQIQAAEASGQVKQLKPPSIPASDPIGELPEPSINEFMAILTVLRQPLKYLTASTTPTFVPKNWLESVQPFDDGASRGVFIYINNSWRKITAT